MRTAHRIVGIVGIVAFVLTGQYMDKVHGHLAGIPDARRLLFRSTHIYLLFGSTINLCLGLYLTPTQGWRKRIRTLGLLLLLFVPVLALLGFCTEPWLANLERPYSRPAIYSCLAGALLHYFASDRRQSVRENPQ